MATKTITHITDDIDGSTDAETVKFGLWGATYEIDLNDEHQKELEAALQPYLDKARRAGSAASSGTRRASAPAAAGSDYDAKEVRAWATSTGVTVPPRGRIPKIVLEQYRAAGN